MFNWKEYFDLVMINQNDCEYIKLVFANMDLSGNLVLLNLNLQTHVHLPPLLEEKLCKYYIIIIIKSKTKPSNTSVLYSFCILTTFILYIKKKLILF